MTSLYRVLPNFLAEETSSMMDALTEGPTYSYWSEFVNMMGSLVLVIGFICASVWILRRVMGAKLRHLNRYASIRIIERRALSQKSSIYLIDVLGQGIVIADSSSGITLLKEFPNTVDINQLIDEQHWDDAPTPLSLKERLAQKLKTLASKRA